MTGNGLTLQSVRRPARSEARRSSF